MSDKAPPELTFRAIVLAIVLAVILAAANAYLGLFAGMTIASAIPAAVVSMAVLKMLGGGHILENNIVATGASAGTSIATGVIFTIPALILLGYWVDFRYTWVLAIAGLGGLLGVLFSVPLRRSLIVDQKLAFPEGKAAAEVLRSGDKPGEGLKILAGAAALGGLIKLAAGSGLRLIPDTASVSTWFDKTIGYFGTNLSPALFGVGYIVGLNIGVVMLAGGAIAWLVAIPIYSTYFLAADPVLSVQLAGASAEDAAYSIWSSQVRFLGVGAMLTGGVWTLFSLRQLLVSGIKSGLMADHGGDGAVVPATERDLPMRYILIGTLVFTLPLLVLYPGYRRPVAGERADDNHHDCYGLPVCLGIGIHGGYRRIVEQSGVGSDYCNHTVCGIGARGVDGAGLTHRRRCDDHDRCRRVQRGLHRWRQPAGPEVRLHTGRDAMEAAAHAGGWWRVERLRYGASTEPARTSLRHRRADRITSQPAARTAGQPDGLGCQGHIRR